MSYPGWKYFKDIFDFDFVSKTFFLNHMTWFIFFWKLCLLNSILVIIWFFSQVNQDPLIVYCFLSSSTTLLNMTVRISWRYLLWYLWFIGFILTMKSCGVGFIPTTAFIVQHVPDSIKLFIARNISRYLFLYFFSFPHFFFSYVLP